MKKRNIDKLLHYSAWANEVMLENVSQLPLREIEAERDCLFKSIAGTFDHILVVEEIFLAHLGGYDHGFSQRSREIPLGFEAVKQGLMEKDQKLIHLAQSWDQDQLEGIITFEFVGGGNGAMSREEILLHLVNHGSSYRGFISTMLFPFKLKTAATDLSVFLRDIWV